MTKARAPSCRKPLCNECERKRAKLARAAARKRIPAKLDHAKIRTLVVREVMLRASRVAFGAGPTRVALRSALFGRISPEHRIAQRIAAKRWRSLGGATSGIVVALREVQNGIVGTSDSEIETAQRLDQRARKRLYG